MTDLLSSLPFLAEAAPAGGAALDQVVIATAGATIATVLLLWLGLGHRRGTVPVLGRLSAFSERVSGLPGWAAVPSAVAGGSLVVALLGMYWDIALHIDDGRDEGPLANPAHYLILAGLFGTFAAGWLAIVLPEGRPGPAAIRITRDWHAPVGGALLMACGGFALTGFPLDDVWHRLFGQDVTLWGPTHLMLIGGAGMTLVAQAVLLAEGMAAKREGGPGAGSVADDGTPPVDARAARRQRLVTAVRRVALMGGFLIGLSTFQAEFDFGVPQYRLVWGPVLVLLAAATALTAARAWAGPGAAIGAALFFLVVRGGVAALVGPVFGETTPVQPLYLVAAVAVELAALLASPARRAAAFALLSGVLVGTVGLASEWGWSHLVMPLPWTEDLLPEAVVAGLLVALAGAAVGTLLARGLRGELPSPRTARLATVLAGVVVLAVGGWALRTSEEPGARASVTLTEVREGPAREAHATVRITPAPLADEAAWVTMTAWQGGGYHLDRLERIGPGTYRTTEPVPLHGNWKSMVRVHRGSAILGAPVFLPADPAIPAAEVPARPRFERALVPDARILQRERDFDAPGWLWTVASLTVLALYLVFLGSLALGVGRIARRMPPPRRAAAGTPGGDAGPGSRTEAGDGRAAGAGTGSPRVPAGTGVA